jgi:hypothetical protein
MHRVLLRKQVFLMANDTHPLSAKYALIPRATYAYSNRVGRDADLHAMKK